MVTSRACHSEERFQVFSLPFLVESWFASDFGLTMATASVILDLLGASREVFVSRIYRGILHWSEFSRLGLHIFRWDLLATVDGELWLRTHNLICSRISDVACFGSFWLILASLCIFCAELSGRCKSSKWQ